MKLGIIADVAEESFAYAQRMGLDFVEFCINGEDKGEELKKHREEIPEWMEKYGVSIQSIGRWKSPFLLENGEINPEEVEIGCELMELAKEFHCPNYVTGCNYVDAIDRMTNFDRAVTFFKKHMEAKPDSVKLSVYNCRKTNFINTPEAWALALPAVPGLGLKFDPSHSYYDGTDYLAELAEWGGYVNHVHLKGGFWLNGKQVDAPAGRDNIDWKSVMNILQVYGYDEGLSIEPHGKTWTNPKMYDRGIAYTINYFRELML